MTPAEFDTRRRSLGLSVGETAALCGVQDRSVRRWQAGAVPIPGDAIDALDGLEDAMLDHVERAVEAARAIPHLAERDAEGFVLWRYRTPGDLRRSPNASSLPLGAHAMLVSWTADALEAEGVDVRIEWADPA